MSRRTAWVLGWGLALAGCNFVQTSAVQAQSRAEPHVEAARAAAGEHHTRIFEYLCRAPRPRQAPTARPPTSRPTAPRAIPDVSTWHAEPAKVFDNLYFLGTQSLNSYAVTTSAGIVIIDPLYDYNAQDEIVDGLEKLGLDPADISHVIVSHGHGDHYGGARLLQERYGAEVLLSAADWELVEASGSSQAKPERDRVVTDGQVLTVGDTEIRFTLTPGHTPGTISTLIPVKDGDETHMAALWGGTAMRPTREFYEAYSASARRFAEVAENAGADIIISNHNIFDDAHAKIAALAERRPGDPHPFVLGPEATVSYMRVAEHCAMAGLARLQIADD